MAYRKFKLTELETKFGIQNRLIDWLDLSKIVHIQPSDFLVMAMKKANIAPLSTEKALSERVISPIMNEIFELNIGTIQLFSGEIINADESQGLNGEIDFLFNFRPYSATPETPIFSITESKIGMLNKAWAQAAAQMLGVSILNQNQNHPLEIFFGGVTDGNSWQFMKLENKIIHIHPTAVPLAHLPLILGIFQYFIDVYKNSYPSVLRAM
jgi:hypothetical protein